MKVVFPTCCGVDVHKSFLVATIIKTTGVIQPSYQKKRFSTFNHSILAFKQWLLDNNCRDVCMESTGKYWIPVFNLLEDEINVTIANPKWVKAVKGNKDDTKDSKWIGDLFRLGLVKGSYIPCKAVRILREYTRYRYKLMKVLLGYFVPFRVSNVIVQSLSSPKSVRICLNSAIRNICAVGQDLLRGATNLLARRNLFELHAQESISNLHWYSVPMQP